MKIHDVFVISPCPKSQKFAHELLQDLKDEEISCILEMGKNVLLLNSENFKWPDVLSNDISKIKFATELYLTNDYTNDILGCYIHEILSCLTNVPALESKPFTWKEKFRIASVLFLLITIYLKEFEKNIFVIVLMVTLCFLANFLTLHF